VMFESVKAWTGACAMFLITDHPDRTFPHEALRHWFRCKYPSPFHAGFRPESFLCNEPLGPSRVSFLYFFPTFRTIAS
jgi:hypothetical protein